MKKVLISLVVAVCIVIIAFSIKQKEHILTVTSEADTSIPVSEPVTNTIATVMYFCDGNQTIKAVYKDTPTDVEAVPGEIPIPTGSVELALSDGRNFDLKQTISASGVRYSDGSPSDVDNETFVFWSKGRTALVLEDNAEKTYTNCIEVKADTSGLPLVYASGTDGFSVRYPKGFQVASDYTNPDPSIKGKVSGVKFTIDSSIATGTNLSADSYLSIEQNSSTTDSCSAVDFISPSYDVTPEMMMVGDSAYSVASTTDAGVGNRYEEWVYAIPGSSPCRAVRYFIHSTVFENYPAGVVTKFDREGLISTFDSIRDSLIVK